MKGGRERRTGRLGPKFKIGKLPDYVMEEQRSFREQEPICIRI